MTVQTVKAARWFMDLFFSDGTVRVWNGTGTTTLDGNTYQGLGERLVPPTRIRRTASVKAETFTVTLDSSRQTDNSDVIGDILDRRWRRRPVRLRQILLDYEGQAPGVGTVLVDEFGRIQELTDVLRDGEPAELTIGVESGSLIYLERRNQTRSPESQKLAFPDDRGFDLAPQLIDAKLPWRTKENRSGAVELNVQAPDEPAPRQMLFGRWVSQGSFVFADTNGQENKYWQRVYALADHQIESLDRLWIDGEPITLPALTPGVRTEIPHFRSGGERCWMTFYDGDPDQTADAYLQSAATAWTAQHRLRGVAYVILEFLWDSDNPQNPEPRFGGLGGLWYDRRLDSTAGGTGAQRWNDPATWTYSANPAVIADHYRLGVAQQASASPNYWFGVGEPADAVPYTEFADLADHCDEQVALKAGGTQARYEAHGSLSAADSHADNLQALADCFVGRAIDQGGRVVLRALRTRTPVLSLTDDDLMRGEDSKLSAAGRIDDLANTVEGRFTDPAQEFRQVDYPVATDSAYVDEDGEQITATFDQSREINGERAQRKASLKLADLRRLVMLEETFLSKAQVLAAGDWFTRTSPLRGFTNKTFEVEAIERRLDGSVKVTALEVDPTQLVWDEQNAVDLSVPPAYPSLTLPGLSVPSFTLTAFEETSGDVVFPAVRLDLTVGELPEQFEIQFAISDLSGGPVASNRIATAMVDGESQSVQFNNFLPSLEYVFRARGHRDGRRSAWSAWQDVVTTARTTATGAGQVEWAGITGTGKPEDNADVTGSNISAGIVGQDWGATASETAASNAVVRAEDQRHNLVDPRYELLRGDLAGDGTIPFTLTNLALVGTAVLNPYLARPAPRFAAQGNAISATVGFSEDSEYPWILPRTRIGYRFAARVQTSGVVSYRWQLRGSDGQVKAQSADIVPNDAAQFAVGEWDLTSSSLDDYRLELRLSLTASNVSGVGCWPYALMMNTLPTGVSAPNNFAFSGDAIRLATVEPNANETETRVAAGIVGQTSLATALVFNQPGPPANAPESSWWFESDRNRLYLRINNAWALVSTVNVGDSGAASGYISGFSSRIVTQPGTYDIGPMIANASNFAGPVSYQWSFASNIDNNFAFVGSTTNASILVRSTIAAGEQFFEAQCTMTDGTDTATAAISGGLYLGS